MCALAALVTLALVSGVQAQAFPSKPVRVVIPSAPGSGIDRMGRMLAERVSGMWGQPVIVENRVGGASAVGTEHVARSAPDGYTTLLGFTSIVQVPVLLPKVLYDINRDFLPVTMVAYVPLALAVRADSPIRTVAEFLDAAKTAPLSYGTFGNGSTPHIYSETLARGAAVRLTHVPYKGEALALTDVLGGRSPRAGGHLGC
jgi:tripartite-type tricarboxylate transporter receptor subunit TctC